MIITLKGADFSASNIGTLSTWRVTRSLGSGATYEGPTSVDKGAPFNATITIAEGYEIGSAGVSITMGGIAIQPASIVDNVILIMIESVTGNIVIKVPTVNINTGEEEEPDTPVVPDVLTVYKTDATKDGALIMDYKDEFAIQISDSAKSSAMQIVAADVSNYVGRQVKITATQAVIDGAYYTMFTNALAGGYSLEALSTLSRDQLETSTSVGKKKTLDRDIIVDKFVVSTASYKTNTVTKTVPVGAKYLYVTNIRAKEGNPQTAEPNIELI